MYQWYVRLSFTSQKISIKLTFHILREVGEVYESPTPVPWNHSQQALKIPVITTNANMEVPKTCQPARQQKEDAQNPGGTVTHRTFGREWGTYINFLGETEVVFTPGMEWGPLVGSIGGLYENLKIVFEYLLFGEPWVTTFWSQQCLLLYFSPWTSWSCRGQGKASLVRLPKSGSSFLA